MEYGGVMVVCGGAYEPRIRERVWLNLCGELMKIKPLFIVGESISLASSSMLIHPIPHSKEAMIVPLVEEYG